MLFLALVAGAAQATTLTVNSAPPPPPSLSTEASVENGDGSLVNEFGIQGAPKQILLRALGPSLVIGSPLANPTLELRNGDGALIASNDDWRSDQEPEIQATGLAPPNDLEAAILVTLNPGFYAAVVRGKSGGTGNAIGEVYDLDPSNPSSSLPAFGTRGIGHSPFSAEVVCFGQLPVSSLVRALGPSLSNAGISGAVQDPALSLLSGNGTLLATNDNWRSDQRAEIEATGLAPTDDRESAIVRNLAPGNYKLVPYDTDTGNIIFVQFYRLPYSGNPLPVIPIPRVATPTPTPSPTATATATATGTPSPTPAAQAINLSTRMRVQTDDNVGIGGFIITGTAPKHVLLRAIGPSLTQSGVPNVLADPVMELNGPTGFATITNDNWRDDPAQEAVIIASGIAPTNDLESAIDANLSPGAYTAIIRGKNNTLGVGLVEVYDLSQAALAKLANISTRAYVSTGDDIVIAGFILGSSSGHDRIVVRGIGPSLTPLGVPDALADPVLELHNASGALLVADDDWQDDPAQAAELTAAGLAPTNQLESGITTTLPPGLYTALLAGLSKGKGVGLVEIYDRGTP